MRYLYGFLNSYKLAAERYGGGGGGGGGNTMHDIYKTH